MGRGLEDVWAALCDEAVGGNLKATMEVLRLSDEPSESSKGETERSGELTGEDYELDHELFEVLSPDLQALCLQNELQPTAILDRFYRELPLSADELRLAQALDPGDED